MSVALYKDPLQGVNEKHRSTVCCVWFNQPLFTKASFTVQKNNIRKINRWTAPKNRKDTKNQMK